MTSGSDMHTQEQLGGETRIWSARDEVKVQSNIHRFMQWLGSERDHQFSNYEDLRRWSVQDIDGFWAAVWDYFGPEAEGSPLPVREGKGFEVTWFPNVRLNYAEHLLRPGLEKPDEIALVHSTEQRPQAEMTWAELDCHVRAVANWLRSMGIVRGDRIVSYMPNTVETVIAMLATTAVGAIWSSASLEFGAATVIDRFAQIEPNIIFAADGYSFGGKVFDRRREIVEIVSALSSLKQVIYFEHLGVGQLTVAPVPCCTLSGVLATPCGQRSAFKFERVGSRDPLWVLYSSGTTGKPKAILHSHVGVLIEHLKFQHFHAESNPSKRVFIYTTTGWMMWNALVAVLLTGGSIVLYDGSPFFEGAGKLWSLAAQAKATSFGASPAIVQVMRKAGVQPGLEFDLSSLQSIGLSGAPASQEAFDWLYDAVKPDIWVSSSSGGTELCSGLVGGSILLPVHSGEIQARCLAMDVDCWDGQRRSVTDQDGELVVVQPFPSAPIGFWGDPDRRRLNEAYFEVFSGVWCHGDLIRINARGGCVILGRSDSTLNRFGVRIGTAEIYRVVESFDEIADSMIIALGGSRGDESLPLFVQLRAGHELSAALRSRIENALRNKASPRHVPSEIIEVPEIPYTLTGKKMEIPIRKLLSGNAMQTVASTGAMRNPGALDWYIRYAAAL